VGDDFTNAVLTQAQGLYTLDLATDFGAGAPVAVGFGMHVTVAGGEGTPGWSYGGEGDAFEVALGGFLTLDRIALHGNVAVDVGGSCVATSSQLVDADGVSVPLWSTDVVPCECGGHGDSCVGPRGDCECAATFPSSVVWP
jgi:hypothetical protein